MDLHEFQAKAILARHGVPVPAGQVAWTAEEAARIASELGVPRFVVKAQILAGGRGEAGGVKLTHSAEGVRACAAGLLGTRLVTAQTSGAGRAVRRVYVEQALECARELYLGILLDRSAGRIVLLGAGEGGEQVEERMRNAPESLVRLDLKGTAEPDAQDLSRFANALGLDGALADQAVRIGRALARAIVELDASLIEINPLCVTTDGRLLALDVKMAVDDNATTTRLTRSSSRRSATISTSCASMATSAWWSREPDSGSPRSTSCATRAGRRRTSWTSARRRRACRSPRASDCCSPSRRCG
jgi:succinyl-CoA synthetase beta subunit